MTPSKEDIIELSRLHNQLREYKNLRRMENNKLSIPLIEMRKNIEHHLHIKYDADIDYIIQKILILRTKIKKPLNWSREYKLRNKV